MPELARLTCRSSYLLRNGDGQVHGRRHYRDDEKEFRKNRSLVYSALVAILHIGDLGSRYDEKD
jgi:hypothetical protein